MDGKMKIGSVSIKVADLMAMKVFYRDVIGLEILHSSDLLIEMGVDGRVLVRLIALPEGKQVQRSTGLYHLAIRLPKRAALAKWLHHYVEIGNPFWQGASDHVFSEALYLNDPEGNGIEIYADTPKANWPREKDGKLAAYTEPLDLQSLIDESDAEAWSGLPIGTDMGHVHLMVNNLVEARHFYVDVLGFDIKTEYRDSALFLASGDYHHHIGLNTWQSKDAPVLPDNAFGLAEYSILGVTPDEYLSIRNDAVSEGYAVETDTDSFIVRDPSGNLVRIYEK